MGGKRTRRDWETFKKRQDITPPPHSNKLFRSIELNNGLSALLVFDPDMGSDISRAAVSMSVRVGSYFDPPEAQGLAHFVEHMLFLGSDRFPEENSMESYLKMHGGDSNGTTYDYHATYHLYVLPNYLEGTLERFSRIFVAPLLKPNAMNREICAVNSDTTPQQWVWKQYWKIKKFEFDCLDISGLAATSPSDFAQYLSRNMLKYPMRHVISADYVHKTWNPKEIEKLMKEFTPNNMRIDLTVNSFKATDFKTERWFATRFIEEQTPKEITEKWGKISEVDSSLQFLKENPFLPTAFTPRVHSTTFDHPKCIVDKSLIKMWHQCDKKGSSYAFLCINLNCGKYTAKKQLTMDIYKELLEDELGCVMFEGNQANLSSSLSINENKLVLQVSGYREKLSLFLSELWKNVRCFSPSSKRFKSIKAQMVRELKDMDVKTQSEHLMVQMLCERSYGLGKKLRDMKQESFASLKRFIRDMYSQISVEGFCYGDVLEKEAYDISKIFESTLKESSLPQVRNEKRILRVPRRAKLRRDVIVIKKSETNSMVKVYFQIGNQKDLNEDEKAMLTLFNYICEGKLYNQLRTQEQLGYDVHCCTDLTGGVYGFCVHIVSSQYNPNYLLKRIYQFVSDMRSQLEDIPQENLEDYKESVSSDLCSDVNSKWDEIVSKRYNFERRSDEGIYVDLIEKEELIKWYDKYIRELSPNCRKFAICIWGCNTYMMKNSERHHVKIRKKLRLSSTRSWTRLLQRK